MTSYMRLTMMCFSLSFARINSVNTTRTKGMSLSQKVFTSSLWTLSIFLINRSMGLVSTLILVRLLSPEDFGIAALATTMLMLFMAFSQLGIKEYIIKQADISAAQVNTAWSLQIVVNTAIALFLAIFAQLISTLLKNQNLVEILIFLSTIPILAALRNPGVILAEKNLDYSRISKIRITSKFLVVPVTITIAYVYESYWALVIGQFLGELIFLLFSYAYIPHRPKFTFSGYGKVFNQTKWLLLSSVSGFIRSKTELFIVNHKLGAEGVGLYNISREFAHLPLSDVIGPASAPLLAGASSIKTGIQDVYTAILKYLYIALFFIVPCIVGIFFVGDLFVNVVLGAKWSAAIPVFKMISLLMLVFLLYTCVRTLLLIKDDLKILVTLDFIFIGAMALILLPSYVDSLIVLVEIRVALGALFALTLLSIIKFRYKLKLRPIFSLILVVSALCVPMMIALALARQHMPFASEVLQLVSLVLTGGFVFVVTTFITMPLWSKINPMFLFTKEFAGKIYSPVLNMIKK